MTAAQVAYYVNGDANTPALVRLMRQTLIICGAQRGSFIQTKCPGRREATYALNPDHDKTKFLIARYGNESPDDLPPGADPLKRALCNTLQHLRSGPPAVLFGFFFLMHNVLPARPQQWWNIPYYNLPTLRRRPRDDLRPSFGLHLLGPVAGKAVKKKWRPQARRKSGAMQLAMAAAAAKDAGVNKK